MWEVFVWLQMLDESLAKTARTMVDEGKSHFETPILYRQDKLEQYWDILLSKTPSYYASVILHPFDKNGLV